MASSNIFDWAAIRTRLALKPGTEHEYFEFSIRATAKDLINDLHGGKGISLHVLLHDCRLMLEETNDIIWKTVPSIVNSREKFFLATMEVIKSLMEKECVLEDAEDFETADVIPYAKDIQKAEADWDVIASDDV
ncbi:hypothetical protein B0T21DRAFT_351325 [Apiosordaria backusii]|uniref:Uncharacterized protein n=1 Tax=Apiosordaria backusii TaxID=314023 RepID=A0AA40ASW4_9PEZI|nr:hypothetical protein B0T21DRAFT_351325 [Apiosordaria backusii]